MRMVDETRLGERLRELRENKRLKQNEIAAQLGISKQLVNHWEHGRSWPSLEHLARLSRLYESSVDYIIGRDDGTSCVVQAKTATRVFSPDDLAPWFANEALQTRNFIAPVKPHSANSIAFYVSDRAMVPSFEPGDLVIVDPEVPAQPGDCVAVSLPQEKAFLFRRFRPEREDLKLEAPFSLRPDNPDYPTRLVTPDDRPKVWGTLAEHTAFGPRR